VNQSHWNQSNKWTTFLTNFKPVRVSDPAKKDLQLISKYTEQQWGNNQKDAYLALFKVFFKKLSSQGNIGSQRDDINKGLFFFPVKKHMVYYRESDNEFSVIRVLHVRMDVEKHLKK